MMNSNHRVLAIFAVAVFMVSACIVFSPVEKANAESENMLIGREVDSHLGYAYSDFDADWTYDMFESIYEDILVRITGPSGNVVALAEVRDPYLSSWGAGGMIHFMYVAILDSSLVGKYIRVQTTYTAIDGDTYTNYQVTMNRAITASDVNNEITFMPTVDLTEDGSVINGKITTLAKVEFDFQIHNSSSSTTQASGYDQIDPCYLEMEWSDGTKYTTHVNYSTNGTGISNMPNNQTATNYMPLDGVENIWITLSNTTPVKSDGSSFQGWSTSQNASTSMYAVGERIQVSPGATVTLYPVFTPPNHTVTFMLDGEVYETVTVPNGSFVTRPSPDPVSDDPTMVFANWYTDNTFQTQFPFNQAITANTTVFGNWMEKLDIVTNPEVHGSITRVDGTVSTYFFDATGSKGDVLWDFGNGDTSTAVQGTYYYSEPGDYEGKLTVTNDAGDKSVVWEFSVHIDEVDGTEDSPDDGPGNSILWIAAGVLAAMVIVLVIVRFVL